jgi:hypothetical protein
LVTGPSYLSSNYNFYSLRVKVGAHIAPQRNSIVATRVTRLVGTTHHPLVLAHLTDFTDHGTHFAAHPNGPNSGTLNFFSASPNDLWQPDNLQVSKRSDHLPRVHDWSNTGLTLQLYSPKPLAKFTAKYITLSASFKQYQPLAKRMFLQSHRGLFFF